MAIFGQIWSNFGVKSVLIFGHSPVNQIKSTKMEENKLRIMFEGFV